jgi:hypothetical protein
LHLVIPSAFLRRPLFFEGAVDAKGDLFPTYGILAVSQLPLMLSFRDLFGYPTLAFYE